MINLNSIHLTSEQIISRAPGRINLIGEHTDYNDGFVLPAAINYHMTFQLQRHENIHQCVVTAKDLDLTYSFDLRNYSRESGGWQNYVMGVVSELQKLGVPIEGFTGSFSGSVPIGGGVSSSAALENSLALGLLQLFPCELDDWQIIKACQMAEHNFAGIKCGIMDQFSSMLGKEHHAMLLDCRSLAYEYYPIELGAYELVLLNTNVSHELASSEYNVRRSQCEEGTEIIRNTYPGIQNLRDVTFEMLAKTRQDLSDVLYQRCHHVVSENARVMNATKALSSGRLEELGSLMYASHHSLSSNYEVSCPELDFLVNFTKDRSDVLGSRMMGGGFGGCTINLVEKQTRDSLFDEAAKAYNRQFNLGLSTMVVEIGDGAKYLNS